MIQSIAAIMMEENEAWGRAAGSVTENGAWGLRVHDLVKKKSAAIQEINAS